MSKFNPGDLVIADTGMPQFDGLCEIVSIDSSKFIVMVQCLNGNPTYHRYDMIYSKDWLILVTPNL